MQSNSMEYNRLKLVEDLYKMSLEELLNFKKLAYGNVSEAIDRLIDKAEEIKRGN